MTIDNISRDTVFVAGGQPSITYIDRKQLDIERHLARAIATPNQITSLAGPTKSGKTVLCRHVLGDRQYVWIDGGQTPTAKNVWDKISYELNFPVEITKGTSSQTGVTGAIKGMIFSAGGSHLRASETKRKFTIDSIATATQYLLEHNISLIIDDFHYLTEEAKTEFLRNIKGPVFNGLRVVLISITHRVFAAVKAEPELTGRFASVSVPEWSNEDLCLIPQKGFSTLNVSCPPEVINHMADECQKSPFLMQKFCWDICYDLGIDSVPKKTVKIPPKINLEEIFVRIAKDSGLPIYERLVAGPQIRKDRLQRPLTEGGEADVYQATLLAIAQTGPKPSIAYNELRGYLSTILSDKVPAKHEVTAVLKQLSKISREMGNDIGVDWDDDKRQLHISDPYLRFYLRWQIRRQL